MMIKLFLFLYFVYSLSFCIADDDLVVLSKIDKQSAVRQTYVQDKQGQKQLASKALYGVANKNGISRTMLCHIYDANGKLLYKIRYGYHRANGFLITEAFYDVKNKKTNEKGQEIPLERLYYKYDAHGLRSKPFRIVKSGKSIIGRSEKIQKMLDDLHFYVKSWESTVVESKDLTKLLKAEDVD